MGGRHRPRGHTQCLDVAGDADRLCFDRNFDLQAVAPECPATSDEINKRLSQFSSRSEQNITDSEDFLSQTYSVASPHSGRLFAEDVGLGCVLHAGARKGAPLGGGSQTYEQKPRYHLKADA